MTSTTDRPPQNPRGASGQRRPHLYALPSSLEEVRDTTECLAELPRRWGWPESRIKVIDGDPGQSGPSTPNRLGFQQMLDLIDQEQVGLVVVRDVSRLFRDPLNAEIFLIKAVGAGILILAEGLLLDSARHQVLAELFGTRIRSLSAWFEHDTSRRPRNPA